MSRLDEEIMKVLEDAGKRNKAVSVDTISYVTHIPRRTVSEHLQRLERDDEVEVKTNRRSRYFKKRQ